MFESLGINLEELSKKYGGKEVRIITGSDTIRGVKYPSYSLDVNDETIKSLRAEFNDTGIELRILEPGSLATMDHEPFRVNARIVEAPGKKWCLASTFDMG